jgi:hypothetical protein
MRHKPSFGAAAMVCNVPMFQINTDISSCAVGLNIINDFSRFMRS